MPFSDSQRHLEDILESIGFIDQFVDGIGIEQYRADEKTKSAVERKIQILTEAVIRLEHEGPQAFPEIDWSAYRGMGNFLRHSYHRVDDQIVWNTIKEDLPLLKSIVQRALHAVADDSIDEAG